MSLEMFMGTTLWESCGTSQRSDSALHVLFVQSKLVFLHHHFVLHNF